MTAFLKGSKLPKGAEITFTDVIAETRKSKVIFESSGKDKVVCELASPPNQGNPEFFVGNRVTVVGKVRGRGMLGNVTLDKCNLALRAAEKLTAEGVPESMPEPSYDETVDAGAQLSEAGDTPSPESIDDAAITSAAGPVSPTRQPLRPNAAVVPRNPAASVEIASSSDVPPRPDEVPVQPNTEGPLNNVVEASRPYAFYAVVAGLIGVALFAFGKFGPALIAATRVRTSSQGAPTERMRRDALEALLLGSKKNK